MASSSSKPRMTDTLASFFDRCNTILSEDITPVIDFDQDDFETRLSKIQNLLDAVTLLLQQHVDDPDQSQFIALFLLREELTQIIAHAERDLKTPLRSSQNGPLLFQQHPEPECLASEMGLPQSESDSSSSSSHEEDESPLFEAGEGNCLICWETDSVSLLKLPCSHTYCAECLRAYLHTAISNAQVERISCPSPGCDFIFQCQHITALASPEDVERYTNFSMLAFLRNDPHTIFCPYHGCDAYMSLDEGVVPEHAPTTPCYKCGGQICPRCGKKEHRFGDNPVSCQVQVQEAKKETQNELDSKTRRRLRNMGVQPCPTCGVAIVRTTGCPSMVCTGCGGHFEWKGDPGETTFEKVAFFYPRTVRDCFTSREAHSEGLGTQFLLGGIVGLILLPAAIPTVVLGVPATMLWGGRKIKHGIRNAVQDITEIRAERRAARQARRAARAQAQNQTPALSSSSSSSSSSLSSSSSTSPQPTNQSTPSANDG